MRFLIVLFLAISLFSINVFGSHAYNTDSNIGAYNVGNPYIYTTNNETSILSSINWIYPNINNNLDLVSGSNISITTDQKDSTITISAISSGGVFDMTLFDGNFFTLFKPNFDSNFLQSIAGLDLNNSLSYLKSVGYIPTEQDIDNNALAVINNLDLNNSLNYIKTFDFYSLFKPNFDSNFLQSILNLDLNNSLSYLKSAGYIPTEADIDNNALEIINNLDLNNSLNYAKTSDINSIFARISDINGTYAKTSDVNNSFLRNSDVNQVYYKQTDANNILVKKTDFNSFSTIATADINAQARCSDTNAVINSSGTCISLTGFYNSGGGSSGAWTLIAEKTLTIADSNIDIQGLAGNTAMEYMIIGNVLIESTSDNKALMIAINNRGSSVYGRYLKVNGSTITGGAAAYAGDTWAQIGDNYTGVYKITFTGTIIAKTGLERFYNFNVMSGTGNSDPTSRSQFIDTGTFENTGTEITEIDFRDNGAVKNFSAGSRIAVYGRG